MEDVLHVPGLGGGERGHADDAGVVEHPGPSPVNTEQLAEIHQLPLDSELQPALELTNQELQVAPAQPVTEDGDHP